MQSMANIGRGRCFTRRRKRASAHNGRLPLGDSENCRFTPVYGCLKTPETLPFTATSIGVFMFIKWRRSLLRMSNQHLRIGTGACALGRLENRVAVIGPKLPPPHSSLVHYARRLGRGTGTSVRGRRRGSFVRYDRKAGRSHGRVWNAPSARERALAERSLRMRERGFAERSPTMGERAFNGRRPMAAYASASRRFTLVCRCSQSLQECKKVQFSAISSTGVQGAASDV